MTAAHGLDVGDVDVVTPADSERRAASPVAGRLARTRQRLVRSAREEIAETGNFSADGVAARAGISVATFYNHFATREDALIAAYESLMRELLGLVREQCRIERLLDQGLEAFIAEWLDRSIAFFGANSSLFRLAQAATTTSKPMRDVFRRHEALALEDYVRFIELAQSAGRVRKGDRQAMARVLLVITESWNHPLMRKATAGSALHREWTESLYRILAPEVPA